MITNLIVTAFLAGLDAVLSLFPIVAFPTDVGMSIGNTVGEINLIFPLKLVMQLFVASIAVRIALNTFDMGVWVYHQFWGSD